MENEPDKGLTDEQVQKELALLSKPPSGFPISASLRAFARLVRRTSSTSTKQSGHDGGTIAAGEVLEVLEKARSISLRLPASDAKLESRLEWKIDLAVEFLKTLPQLDRRPLHELRQLLSDLGGEVARAELFANADSADKAVDVTGALNRELLRIKGIAEDEELDQITYVERQDVKAELYGLDVLARTLFARAEELRDHETALCEWRKLAPLCTSALTEARQQLPTYPFLASQPIADSITGFDKDLVELCDRIRATAAAISKKMEPPPDKPEEKEDQS